MVDDEDEPTRPKKRTTRKSKHVRESIVSQLPLEGAEFDLVQQELSSDEMARILLEAAKRVMTK